MDATTKVFDPNGEKISKGTRVQIEWFEIEWFDDEDGERVEHHWLGTVDHVTDAEGDADDEGRAIGINPRVFVQWDEEFADPGDLEDFSTTFHNGWHDRATGDGEEGWFECDELEVVNA